MAWRHGESAADAVNLQIGTGSSSQDTTSARITMGNARRIKMGNASKIVSDYQQALGKGDFAAARKLVHDNLLFQGPLDTFHSPEPYFEALKKLHPIVQRIDMKKIFADGNDVCVLYDMVTKTSAGTAFVCEWYKVKGEKIAEIRTLFDARPFAAMFAVKAAT